MKATVLVADAAQAVDGKIYALGLGWSHVGTPTPPHALIILLDVDWNETNHRFQLRAELVDSDMHEVTIQTSIGEQPVVLEAELEVGRPAGLPRGTAVRVPFTATFGSLNLVAGSRYEWRVTIDGRHEEDWSETFTVRPR
ncbi:hypothetical protein JMUB5695_01863 [Mycobacterium heckeshornense]|uniref:DUF6941 family protein n=1 Tax=Mycobacterium heckeshornense TaxID=110505 RepID=UPI0019457244|nr:hypothetical protein [Mycobacterium heckeshornense]BCQ08431.1 hypothetical protein JMUB5695_01863 [Mycobacterium heckeshornense]